MAQKNNAYCTICGKPYYVCMSCQDAMRLTPWKIHTDTAEHFKVSQVVHGVSTNVYTKDEAKMKLKNINLDDIDTFKPHIKKIIEDILKEDKPITKPVKKVEESVETEVVKVEENAEKDVAEVENSDNIVKPAYTRKRNYKVDAE